MEALIIALVLTGGWTWASLITATMYIGINNGATNEEKMSLLFMCFMFWIILLPVVLIMVPANLLGDFIMKTIRTPKIKKDNV